MQFIDLHRQFERLEDDIRVGLEAVLQHQQFIMGPEVAELERQLAVYTGRRHAITCANGTDALVLALEPWGLKENDAVFVPSFTFVATAECVSIAGGTPMFVDVDPDTFNLCPDALEQAVRETLKQGRLRPRGIIAVDLFGLPANYRHIIAVAERYGLFVVEDGAQSFGGAYEGRKACGFGYAATTSFFPSKPLGCYGDGGTVFTDDDALAERLKSIRTHGKGRDKYDNVRIGCNSRLDTIQAAVLLAKLKVLNEELEARNRIAAAYTGRLGVTVKTPRVLENCRSAWAQYTVVTESGVQRNALMEGLKARDIPAMVYYPKPLHLSAAYGHLGYREGMLPVCENLCRHVISLPMHPYLTEEEIDRVADAVIALC